MDRNTAGGLMMIGLFFAGLYIWLSGSSAEASTNPTGEIPRDRSPVVDGAMQGWLGIFDYINPFADDGDDSTSFNWFGSQSPTPLQSSTGSGDDLYSSAQQLGLYPTSGGNSSVGGLLGYTSVSTQVAIPSNAEDLLARTVWGEAGGEGFEGMQAVASVILNRVRKGGFGSGIVGVIKKPNQFSMWGADIARGKLALAANATTPGFAAAMRVASLAVSGQLPDNTGGALYYLNVSNLSSMPSWTKNLTQTAAIGAHTFYAESRAV